ncbi:CaiB/BaiF CoA-transferase family protein [Malikia sp.]|uniref:CaiB/BaiF CoA transferase family protein n=1 Tax=Malikia sp. TaxID=2070706 RepID=UPI00260EA821|nr:CaiB/BaiF CoA-transferase family protein [Malikia sp.]MDD2728445.1 CaiB/BaiF CoA-transferase family protein [Malikia sp.]
MGPLQGIKIIEFAALGPAPMGTMLLADLGAEVLRIERKAGAGSRPTAELFDPALDILNRNRRVVALDLKRPEAIAAVLRLVEGADALIEGFRPGVMERLGLGPEVCLQHNPRLVYGRMTGWGQQGLLAQSAGHDINYLSLSGALHAIGEPGRKPVVPLNLVADGGGGAMLLALGVLAGLLEARGSGQGQVVDAAMTDGAALLMSMMYTLKAMGQWQPERGSNLLDGGAHFYDTYECRDGKWLSIGAIEPQFYALLLEKTGITDPEFQQQWDRSRWPRLKEKLAQVIGTRTRDEWCEIFDGTDACVAPVLDMDEAPRHPHNRSRHTFTEVGGVVQPAAAPRFSRTPPARPAPPQTASDPQALLDWGFNAGELAALREQRLL